MKVEIRINKWWCPNVYLLSLHLSSWGYLPRDLTAWILCGIGSFFHCLSLISLLSVVLSQSGQEHTLDGTPVTRDRWVLEGGIHGQWQRKLGGGHGVFMTKASLSEKPE